MEIIDEENIIPDKNIIMRIIKDHPLCENLHTKIRNVFIKLLDPSGAVNKTENIEKNNDNSDVSLFIFKDTPAKVNYECILYHEFSHIADRLNPDFKYSEEKKKLLTDLEKLKVMNLWNLFIDSRLNAKKLFVLEKRTKPLMSKYGILPNTIEGKLLEHISQLESAGLKTAKDIVEGIWNNPERFLSYDDLIKIVKLNSA